jgi:RNA polymerase sigma factor (sigma-70 family)
LQQGPHAVSENPTTDGAARLARFDALVAACERPLLRYVARILRDPDAAQDVVQETLVRCYRRWDGDLAPSPMLLRWLYRVAHNRAVDLLRHEARRTQLHDRHAKESEGDAQPGSGEHVEVSQAAERAAAAMQALSVREQQLVILKVYEERSYKEIAELTGLTVGNVGYILHHAMRKLAAELNRKKAP